MIRAALIKPGTAEVEIIEVDEDSLEDWQRLITGGSMDTYIESVTLPGGLLLVDEHGKLKREVPNEVATRLVMPVIGDFIVGNALLFGPPRRSKPTSITPEWIERLLTVGAVVKGA